MTDGPRAKRQHSEWRRTHCSQATEGAISGVIHGISHFFDTRRLSLWSGNGPISAFAPQAKILAVSVPLFHDLPRYNRTMSGFELALRASSCASCGCASCCIRCPCHPRASVRYYLRLPHGHGPHHRAFSTATAPSQPLTVPGARQHRHPRRTSHHGGVPLPIAQADPRGTSAVGRCRCSRCRRLSHSGVCAAPTTARALAAERPVDGRCAGSGR